MSLRDVLAAMAAALWKYIDDNDTGSGFLGKFPAIEGEDPVHTAVVAVERHYPDNKLPYEGRLLWIRLLELSRSVAGRESRDVGTAAWDLKRGRSCRPNPRPRRWTPARPPWLPWPIASGPA